jgi:hypothetical protein
MMANMADGGLTPMLPAKVLEEIGFAFAIYPSMTSLVAAAAMEQALSSLKAKGSYDELPIFDFQGILRPDRIPGGLGFRKALGQGPLTIQLVLQVRSLQSTPTTTALQGAAGGCLRTC